MWNWKYVAQTKFLGIIFVQKLLEVPFFQTRGLWSREGTGKRHEGKSWLDACSWNRLGISEQEYMKILSCIEEATKMAAKCLLFVFNKSGKQAHINITA